MNHIEITLNILNEHVNWNCITHYLGADMWR